LSGYAWGGEVVGWIDMSGVKINSTGSIRLWAGTNGNFTPHPLNPGFTETFNTNPNPVSTDPATIIIYPDGYPNPAGGTYTTKVQMKWNVSGMQSCAVTHSVNAPNWTSGPSTTNPVNGVWLTSITEGNITTSIIRKTYTITCVPDDGGPSVAKTAIVDILPYNAVVDLSADPGALANPGDTSVLSWYGVNLNTTIPCTASTVGLPTASDWNASTNPTSTATPSNIATKVVLPPLAIPTPVSITYKITCTSLTGALLSDTAVVSLSENSNLTLTPAIQNNIPIGGNINLNWSYNSLGGTLGHCVPIAIPPTPPGPNPNGGVTNWDNKFPDPMTTAGFGTNPNPLPTSGTVSVIAVPGTYGETTSYRLDCVQMVGMQQPVSSNMATAKLIDPADILGFYISGTDGAGNVTVATSSTNITVTQKNPQVTYVQLDWDGGSSNYDWYGPSGKGFCTASNGNYSTNGAFTWTTQTLKAPGKSGVFNFAIDKIRYPNATNTAQYTITCNDGALVNPLIATKTVTLNVIPDPVAPPTLQLQASTNSVPDTNRFVDLTWAETTTSAFQDLDSCVGIAKTSGGSSITINPWTGSITDPKPSNGFYGFMGGVNVPAPIGDYTSYQVRCIETATGNFIYSNTEKVNVIVPLSNLSVDLQISNDSVNFQNTPPYTPYATLPSGGGQVTLKWTTVDAQFCGAYSSIPASSWKGTGPWSPDNLKSSVNGNEQVTVSVSTTFTIRCQDLDGNLVDDSVGVMVGGVPPPPPPNGVKKPFIKEF
jgi:hypothetical protein